MLTQLAYAFLLVALATCSLCHCQKCYLAQRGAHCNISLLMSWSLVFPQYLIESLNQASVSIQDSYNLFWKAMMALFNPQPSKKQNSYLSKLYFFYLKQKRKSVTPMPYKSAPSITVKNQRDCRLHTLGKALQHAFRNRVMAACHSHFFLQSWENWHTK